MEKWIIESNLARYRALLEDTQESRLRSDLMRLIAEETRKLEQYGQASGAPPERSPSQG